MSLVEPYVVRARAHAQLSECVCWWRCVSGRIMFALGTRATQCERTTATVRACCIRASSLVLTHNAGSNFQARPPAVSGGAGSVAAVSGAASAAGRLVGDGAEAVAEHEVDRPLAGGGAAVVAVVVEQLGARVGARRRAHLPSRRGLGSPRRFCRHSKATSRPTETGSEMGRRGGDESK